MFFSLVWQCLNAKSIESKLSLLEDIKKLSSSIFSLDRENAKSIMQDSKEFIKSLSTPSYESFCKVLPPVKIRRIKHINSDLALAKLIHSITHIEYCAIDLALDAVYRFRDLPLEFYSDWLVVAMQESRHFCLLRENLNRLGYEYGEFSVHNQLFLAQCATNSLTERMALVHKGLEANGLDANPFVAQKIADSNHYLQQDLLDSLKIILNDEIEHVAKGDKWWRFSTDKTSASDFYEILQRHKHLNALPRTINKAARVSAGFSPDELELLESKRPIKESAKESAGQVG